MGWDRISAWCSELQDKGTRRRACVCMLLSEKQNRSPGFAADQRSTGRVADVCIVDAAAGEAWSSWSPCLSWSRLFPGLSLTPSRVACCASRFLYFVFPECSRSFSLPVITTCPSPPSSQIDTIGSAPSFPHCSIPRTINDTHFLLDIPRSV